LRRLGPATEDDPSGWPPSIADVASDDQVCVAAQLTPTEDGWRVEPLQAVPAVADIPENALVVTRDTELGFTLGRPSDASALLLGLRVEDDEPGRPGRLVHVVVTPGGIHGRRAGTPRVVPARSLVVTEYMEQHGQTQAAIGLRLSPADLQEAKQWMSDRAVEVAASRVVDRAVLSPRARHMLTLEVHAGRVSLHGRAELATSVDAAIQELEAAPGIVDVLSHVLQDETLTDLVEQALAERGITGVTALSEHGLVSLHGVAPDAATRRKAEDTVARIPGVRGVVNRIEVAASV
jgi:osmotically-inducible protein OsmY